VQVVDRALDYVALADAGLSATRIARKRRRSAGYVSILLRLGRAIATLEPAELAALRSPRVTWKLAQRVVRSDADTGSIRHQLRLALGGFSTHNVDRRQHRPDRQDGPARGAVGGSRRAGAPGRGWGWDDSWFTRDPVEYVRCHLAHLTGVHRAVVARAARAVSQGAVRRLSVGQSLAVLQRSLAAAATAASVDRAAGAPSPRAEDRALAALAILERHLAAAERELVGLLDLDPAAGAPVGAGTARPRPGGSTAGTATSGMDGGIAPTARPLPFEVDEDLAG
jgi:hypothetical protein